ncbi:UDP-N-acetylmuramoyl-tripeptide--D-alanyl-D-alanine ligase [Methylocaldum sp.]|uniref:UDP-N-acetylmuramoyl-tripeptide--D-alanyl-D- alanine ligase n=1 Tax=Methylocaldum sp. TaxID=1969727 RepID=UPI002D69FD03|nr:UDP-N-acetylmuramoyl-tripeptide--D-alanyl-D-alanine ligase [Methylocaldum sp.]HYE35823.1 UDP-N-acetylmuramoyl-tripeptide--D-alanyl-D-alanine ligase [Methylocaldum sp.]
MTVRLSEFSGIVGGECRGADVSFENLGIDTRSLKSGDLYLAIRGTHFDGNDFVAQAKAAGACASVVERWADCDLPQVRVDDGRAALGRFSAAWRDRWTGRLVGITGSNGKTTVKELIAAVLGVAAPVLKTQGNLNNDIGVPLTLLQLRAEHRFAAIEMGANHAGEIAYASGLARPDVAVISNAGAAHLEGFGSLEGVVAAKGELITSLGPEGTAVLNADDRFFGRWCEMARGRAIISFGFGPDAVVRADADSMRMGLSEGKFCTSFDLLYRGGRYPLALALAGGHNVTNALAAAATAFGLGFDIDQIQTGLSRAMPVPGRLEPVNGIHGTLLINDAYNANPNSFRAALDVLLGLSGEPWVALGAFGELGEMSGELHAEIGHQAKAMGVARLFAVGPNADRAAGAFGEGALYCRDQDELIERLQQQIDENVVLLIKGSRSQRMERVVEALRERSDPCC